jgi:uncharacterized protein YndB with AHSA1/START domain
MTTATTPAATPEGVVSAASDAEGIRIVRVFDAPRELVFTMWTQPEHFIHWFGEHGSEIPLESCEMDPRPGGAWRATMYHGPERIEIPFSGEFRAVDPPAHLEMTLADPTNPRQPAREMFTVDLRDLGGGRTEMRFSQSGGNLPSDEYSRAMRGMLIFLERQAAHLAGIQHAD